MEAKYKLVLVLTAGCFAFAGFGVRDVYAQEKGAIQPAKAEVANDKKRLKAALAAPDRVTPHEPAEGPAAEPRPAGAGAAATRPSPATADNHANAAAGKPTPAGKIAEDPATAGARLPAAEGAPPLQLVPFGASADPSAKPEAPGGAPAVDPDGTTRESRKDGSEGQKSETDPKTQELGLWQIGSIAAAVLLLIGIIVVYFWARSSFDALGKEIDELKGELKPFKAKANKDIATLQDGLSRVWSSDEAKSKLGDAVSSSVAAVKPDLQALDNSITGLRTAMKQQSDSLRTLTSAVGSPPVGSHGGSYDWGAGANALPQAAPAASVPQGRSEAQLLEDVKTWIAQCRRSGRESPALQDFLRQNRHDVLVSTAPEGPYRLLRRPGADFPIAVVIDPNAGFSSGTAHYATLFEDERPEGERHGAADLEKYAIVNAPWGQWVPSQIEKGRLISPRRS